MIEDNPNSTVDHDADETPKSHFKMARHGVKENIAIEGQGRVTDREQGFRFGRMLSDDGVQPVVLRMTTCRVVGDQMALVEELNRADSELPAGYTYFGQFVDHDISFDGTEAKMQEADDPDTDVIEITPDADLVQERSPSLDLDSLYGGSIARNGALFDGSKFKIGKTNPLPAEAGEGPIDRALDYDLPREPNSETRKTAHRAIIGDKRNDENLAVAQTHLMWLKFHNHIIDRLRIHNPSRPEVALFSDARELTTRHYQHVVLNDFVRRIISQEVYDDVIVNGNRKILRHSPSESVFMPLEFSVAAYRFGHSSVREVYDWNINFGTGGAQNNPTGFEELFRFSELSGDFGGLETLPSNWIASFARLYDFEGADLPNLAGAVMPRFNLAKKIDAFIAPSLGRLPAALGRPFDNLASLNLRRGSMRGLPSGQDAAKQIPGITALTQDQMSGVIGSDFDQVMQNAGLYERTPLWLYVLLEASATEDGERLGKLGSTIVADTFLTLVVTSRTSIFSNGNVWHPSDALSVMGGGTALETIPQILLWMDALEPIIDPLQDVRLQGLA